MSYKPSDVVKLSSRGISAVHDLTQAPEENALVNVLFFLWNAGGPNHQATIEEIVEGLNWNTNTYGRNDFNKEFSALVLRQYVTITPSTRRTGWDIKLSSGLIKHEDSGTYDEIIDKYPLATNIRKVE